MQVWIGRLVHLFLLNSVLEPSAELRGLFGSEGHRGERCGIQWKLSKTTIGVSPIHTCDILNKMTLWYPGRPPFCTPKLVQLLDVCADTVRCLSTSQDTGLLSKLEAVGEDALETIHTEDVDCLGSDAVLNQLTVFLNGVFIAAQVLVSENRWSQLMELASDIKDVRDALTQDQMKVAI